METAIKLAELPWATLLMLASGYAGYFIAHVGVRDHHKAADITFGTIVFGFWGLLAYQVCVLRADLSSLKSSFVAMFATMLLGAIWSLAGRPALIWFLRKYRITQMDDLPSAWAALGRAPRVNATQLKVKLTDGTEYFAKDLSIFADLPTGSCTFGGNGDMLMYISHVRKPGETKWTEYPEAVHPDWGSEITYIPKDKIARVDLRWKAVSGDRESFFRWFRRGR